MDLTGNPFVDTGLMVLANLAKKDNVDELALADLVSVFQSGEELARNNLALKCFTMVFGTNGPLTQPAYKKTGQNRAIYLGIIRRILEFTSKEGTSGPRCDLTGIPTHFNFHSVCAEALKELGQPVPEQKWLGRDWIPLGGSLGNDAQALPVASRPLHVSALALFAFQYLPLGVSLFKGKLSCLQSTEEELSQAWVSDIVAENQNRLSLGQTEILGKGAGTGGALDLLMRCFEALPHKPGAEAYLWLFSNSGTGADCQLEPVPDSALQFISDASGMFHSEIRRMLSSEPKDSRQQLFECIRNDRDYPGLYPFKKHPGASPEFYEFYQITLRGATKAGLEVARKLALLVLRAETKQLKDIQKPEYLRSSTGKNLLRRFILENLTVGEYESLFPSEHHPIRASSASWEHLRFYLSTEHQDRRPVTTSQFPMKTTHPKIIQIGETYRSIEPRKIKNILDRMTQRKIGIRWLQDKFCSLAETHPDWNLGTWDDFVCDEEGRIVSFELLFQIRLYLSNLYREVTTHGKGETA